MDSGHRTPTRRQLLQYGAGLLPIGAAQPSTDTGCLRARVECIDSLLARAQSAFEGQRFSRDSYVAFLELLRAEELLIHGQAAAATFADPTEDNYWHRSRLKFPSPTAQQLERLSCP